MRLSDSDDSASGSCAPGALDEFAAEDVNPSAVASASAADGVFCFECEPQPEPRLSVSGPLLDIAPAHVSREMSERETIKHCSTHAAQRALGVVGACGPAVSRLALGIARRGAASREHAIFALAATRLSARYSAAAKSVPTLGTRAWTAGSHAFARPFTETALEHQEFNGFVVAVVLAIAVVGYGGFLAAFWRTAADSRVTRATAPLPQQAGDAQTTTAVISAATAPRTFVDASKANIAPVVQPIATVERRPSFAPSVRTLNALWQRRDTRSLDRAFEMLRRETLAFRSCGVRITDVDRAVARCEGKVATLAIDGAPSSRSAMWTIDFQRTAGRWRIARVTTR